MSEKMDRDPSFTEGKVRNLHDYLVQSKHGLLYGYFGRVLIRSLKEVVGTPKEQARHPDEMNK